MQSTDHGLPRDPERLLEIGITGQEGRTVGPDDSARASGSGTLEVFSTPSMIALMEETAWKSVAEYLGADEETVGVSLDIRHLSPTPIGMPVRCESTLIAIDGRILTFELSVFDEVDKIGEGRHTRAIIKGKRFQEKADGKSTL